ncbi:MAG: alpha/beta hydrolase [Gemmatimonadota bacterium]|nr:alpha/beta hydrolase [Gemmatimonadota bacterium]
MARTDTGRVTSLGFVHRFVPATDASSRATILLLHGTGGDENDLISFGQAIAPGAALLSARGNTMENGAPRFFRRIAEGKFDPAEVRHRALELAAFINAAAAEYELDSELIFALGYSNGANIASSVMLLEPELLAGSILFRPMIVLDPEEKSDLAGRAVFIGAGRLDTIVPADQPERLAGMLRDRGASVTVSWQVSGHNLTPADIAAAARWFQMQSLV